MESEFCVWNGVFGNGKRGKIFFIWKFFWKTEIQISALDHGESTSGWYPDAQRAYFTDPTEKDIEIYNQNNIKIVKIKIILNNQWKDLNMGYATNLVAMEMANNKFYQRQMVSEPKDYSDYGILTHLLM